MRTKKLAIKYYKDMLKRKAEAVIAYRDAMSRIAEDVRRKMEWPEDAVVAHWFDDYGLGTYGAVCDGRAVARIDYELARQLLGLEFPSTIYTE